MDTLNYEAWDRASLVTLLDIYHQRLRILDQRLALVPHTVDPTDQNTRMLLCQTIVRLERIIATKPLATRDHPAGRARPGQSPPDGRGTGR